jgi:hypothetical protein
MKLRALLSIACLGALLASAPAVSPRHRTDSGQFTIYCEDTNLRMQIASLAAKTKDDVLGLLGEKDGWKRPIVLTIELHTAPQPVAVNLIQSDVGLKIEIVARIGSEPEDVNLRKQLIRAVLLEYMYRKQAPKADAGYAEPPWWLVEGSSELLRQRDGGAEPGFFRTLIETNKLPPVESFLAEKPDELGPTALAVDRSLAMCLLQLLLDQPDGRRHLATLLRNWSEGSTDPIAALGKEFTGLAGGASALQKWWTLNLARLASTDRYQALSAEATDRRIGALLEFDVPQKDGTPKHFNARDFAEYLKLPSGRQVVAAQRDALVDISVRSNVLLRPVISEYEQCLTLIARGKTRGLRERLDHAERLREVITRRSGEIADYMNWFEATQMGGRSSAFDNYLKTANQISEQERRRRDPIARYLDQLEKEY